MLGGIGVPDIRKRKRLKYRGACMFEVWEMPSGKLRFIAEVEDLKGIAVAKPVPKRRAKKPTR